MSVSGVIINVHIGLPYISLQDVTYTVDELLLMGTLENTNEIIFEM